MKIARIVALAVLSGLLLQGCDWEVVYRGCTDPDASNFDITATEDDGSCLYFGQAVFWYDSAVSDELLFYKSNDLSLYLDNEFMQEWMAADYWLVAPACGGSGTVTVERALESGESTTATYRIEDNFGDVLWEGIVAFNEGSCTAVQLDL
jgi:hypothetical protein